MTNECSSGTATFTVVAGGTPPFGYQWRSNGVTIAGANAVSYNIAAPNFAATGGFDVIVTNNVGSITSTVATFTMVDTTGPIVGVSNITRYLVANSVSIAAADANGRGRF